MGRGGGRGLGVTDFFVFRFQAQHPVDNPLRLRPHIEERSGPLDLGIVDRRLGIRFQGKAVLQLTVLNAFDHYAIVGQTDDAKRSYDFRIWPFAVIVVESNPAIENRSQRVAAYFNSDGMLGG